MDKLAAFLGRILLALIFLLSALSKLGDFDGTVAYMSAKGIPLATAFLIPALAIELCGAVMLITGWKGRMGALMLAAYLIPVTYVFHYLPAFSSTLPVSEQKIQMISMMKNLSIFGGLLMAWANGVGPWTIGKE